MAGDPGYDPAMQRHHLLPRQIMGSAPLRRMVERLDRRRLGFDDFRLNGMLLPAHEETALATSLPLHRGPHRHYNAVVMERLGRHSARHTAYSSLPGGDARPDAVLATLRPRAAGMGLTEEQVQHLVSLYGSRARDVLVLAERRPQLATPFCEHGPTLKAQATYAALNEGAETLADVLLRRAPIGLASCLALDCVEAAAEVVGQTLRWDEERRRKEAAAYRQLVAEQYAAPLAAQPSA